MGDPMQIDSTKSTENFPWVEKYRPSQLDDIVSHDQIITTITKLIDSEKLPHLLFYGPPGTGKTTTILACTTKMYSSNNLKAMTLMLNASDDRGIDIVKGPIRNFCSTKNIFSSGPKLVILDEADQMTAAAQAALRRVIEKYTSNVRFCLICNYVNKITPALQSRCTRFRFSPLTKDACQERIQHVSSSENLNLSQSGTDAILKLSGGDMRKCLNILQSTHMSYSEINAENVYSCTGNPLPADIEEIVSCMLNESYQKCLETTTKLKIEKGLAIQDILKEIHSYVLRIDFDPQTTIQLLTKLADIEYRLASGCDEKLQLSAIIAAFQIIRETAVTNV